MLRFHISGRALHIVPPEPIISLLDFWNPWARRDVVAWTHDPTTSSPYVFSLSPPSPHRESQFIALSVSWDQLLLLLLLLIRKRVFWFFVFLPKGPQGCWRLPLPGNYSQLAASTASFCICPATVCLSWMLVESQMNMALYKKDVSLSDLIW